MTGLPPSRFYATPANINTFLLQHFAEDTLLRYQQAIGERAVSAAIRDIRMDANLRQLEGNHLEAEYGQGLADLVDPAKGAGRWPFELVTWPATDAVEAGQ